MLDITDYGHTCTCICVDPFLPPPPPPQNKPHFNPLPHNAAF